VARPKGKGKAKRAGLSQRQRKFVAEYLKDLDPAAAYRRAGYKVTTDKSARNAASRLLADVGVSEAVAAEMKARAARTEITQDYVLTRLRENVERAMQAVPVTDREGNATGVYEYEGAVANGALKLLGQHLGLFKERIEHSGKDGAPLITTVEVVLSAQGPGDTPGHPDAPRDDGGGEGGQPPEGPAAPAPGPGEGLAQP
jgi:phage terminase small subunit